MYRMFQIERFCKDIFSLATSLFAYKYYILHDICYTILLDDPIEESDWLCWQIDWKSSHPPY